MKDRNYSFAGATRRLDPETISADAAEAARFFSAWRREWREAYKGLTVEIRAARALSKSAPSDAERGMAQSRRHYGRIAASNMMQLLEAAKLERKKIRPTAETEAA